MLKRYIIPAAIILFLGLVVVFYLQLKKRQLPDSQVFDIVPTNTAMIISLDNPIDFMHTLEEDNTIWEGLATLPAIANFQNSVDSLIAWVENNSAFMKSARNNQSYISIHSQGKNHAEFIYYLKLFSPKEIRKLSTDFESLLPTRYALEEREYDGVKLLEIYSEGQLNYAVSFIDGILVMSPSGLLLENVIRQRRVEQKISNSRGFKKVKETAGKNVDGNVFINFRNARQLFSATLSPTLANQFEKVPSIADWAALDINLKKDAVLLNGFSYPADTASNYLNVLLQQEAVDQDVLKILPTNTALYLSLGISDFERYLRDYKAYLEKNNLLQNYRQKLKKWEDNYGVNMEEELKEIMDEEIALLYTDNALEGKQDEFVIMRTKSRSLAHENLIQMLKAHAKREGENLNAYKNANKLDEETVQEMFEFPFSNFFETFFGRVFGAVDLKYYTFTGNFIVFGESQSALSDFAYAQVLEKTLSNDIRFKQFTDYLSDQSNFYFYTNMFYAPEIISNFLNDNLKSGLLENAELFRKFQAFALQFRSSRGMLYNNVFLKYIPDIKEEAVTLWESHMDTSLSFKPYFVRNHYTGENEIFVQDLNHKIYLINKVGRVLWRLQLAEPINSEVFQVDYYKNGKLQLFFSTKSALHLIDRNGNYVERYPIQLRSPSTAGVAVFDYEKNKNYRLLIPCQNRKVYLYGIEGNIIGGWKFDQTDTEVSQTGKHFRNQGKDYIVFADKYRLYIQNRRGETRVKVQDHFPVSKNNGIYFQKAGDNNPARWVATDTSGVVNYVYLDGRIETKDVGRYTQDHYFELADVDADGIEDFIFLDRNQLLVKKSNGDEIFSHEFDEIIDSPPIYFYFGYQDRKIGVVEKEENRIYLFNGNGDLYENFPLEGNTPFSIGYLGNDQDYFNLIVGNRYNFLLNYAVN